MADRPINLNRYRKDRARAEKRARGTENAAKHGTTLAERKGASARAEKLVRVLDGARLDRKTEKDPEA
ncbi:MAG: DUF4169 family protein [Pseudomonadota bacterium]